MGKSDDRSDRVRKLDEHLSSKDDRSDRVRKLDEHLERRRAEEEKGR